MKKGLLLTALALSLFGACREPESKTVVKEVEVEQPQEEKGALERTAEKVDSEVDEKVDEQIDKIGDDN
ncbi:MAG TPA: hypothetical protein ENH91_05500 [Leeuwenhoekiella sp.]|nr:hypothetical protein [Leeuwenhoekiella sp.]